MSLLSFLQSIADRIHSAFSSNGARVQIDVGGDDLLAEGRLGADVGLIVGELVTNALKHAFADRREGRIMIALRGDEEAGALEVTVHDDGPGLPDGMDRPNRLTSLGWRMVESMAARDAGQVDVTNRNGLCVRVTLEEPDRNRS
ncbi:MAG: sensor histidine kinase [Pseudomonadota bacterium]